MTIQEYYRELQLHWTNLNKKIIAPFEFKECVGKVIHKLNEKNLGVTLFTCKAKQNINLESLLK